MLEYLVVDTLDVEMRFDTFMKHVNDYYSQKSTSEGLQRIFSLFDNKGRGLLTRKEIERLNIELEVHLTVEEIEELFIKASQDGITISMKDFETFMYVNM